MRNPLRRAVDPEHVSGGLRGALRQEVGSWKFREACTMSNEDAAPETKGVTAELLATVDLGPEIEGMAGRQLRMRIFTFEPGAAFGPVHDHKDRPGIVYILQGTITDHRDGVATDYGPGVGWSEDRNTRHWPENRGTVPADLGRSCPVCPIGSRRSRPVTNREWRHRDRGIQQPLVCDAMRAATKGSTYGIRTTSATTGSAS
jgi:quercetin dioxygenase-like cupin family protein